MKKTKFYYQIFENGLPKSANAKWIGEDEHFYYKNMVLPNLPEGVGFFREGNTGMWYTFDKPLPEECDDLLNEFGDNIFKYVKSEEVEIEAKTTKIERDTRYDKKLKTPKQKKVKIESPPEILFLSKNNTR